MKGKILLIGLMTFLTACKSVDNVERIQNCIFTGYMGFYLVDTTKWIHDSTQFDIREYLEYNVDSTVKIAKKWHNTKTKYFQIGHEDSIRLISIFNKLLLKLRKDSNYYARDVFEMYDGLHYTIALVTTSNKRLDINYDPQHLPKELKDCHDTIEEIIKSAKVEKWNGFKFSKDLKKNALELYQIFPPPPAPENLSIKVKITTPLTIKPDTNKLN